MIWNMYTIKSCIELGSKILYYIIIPFASVLILICLFHFTQWLSKKHGKIIMQCITNHPGICAYGIITIAMFGIILSVPAEKRKITNCIFATAIWFLITIAIIIYKIHTYKDRKYWIEFHQKYGCPTDKLSIPMSFYGDFNAHFWLHDKYGNVKDSAVTEKEAIQKHKDTGLFITRIVEKYPVEEE